MWIPYRVDTSRQMSVITFGTHAQPTRSDAPCILVPGSRAVRKWVTSPRVDWNSGITDSLIELVLADFLPLSSRMCIAGPIILRSQGDSMFYGPIDLGTFSTSSARFCSESVTLISDARRSPKSG